MLHIVHILTQTFYATQTFGIKFALKFILAVMNINRSRMLMVLHEMDNTTLFKIEFGTLINNLIKILKT